MTSMTSTTSMTSITPAACPWLVALPGAPRAPRLYCFSYAGGSAASYRSWHTGLDAQFEIVGVELPGRARRFHEAPLTSIEAVVAGAAHAIAAQGVPSFAFFGHSLGALVAFEVARYLQRHGLAQPRHLIVSGARAPRRRPASRDLYLLDDSALMAQLEAYNGTPPEVLANAELMALLLPAIRADFALGATYRYAPGPQLGMPMTVLTASDDQHAKENDAAGWALESSAACRLEQFEGGHFFIDTQRASVLACVSQVLRASLPSHT